MTEVKHFMTVIVYSNLISDAYFILLVVVVKIYY